MHCWMLHVLFIQNINALMFGFHSLQLFLTNILCKGTKEHQAESTHFLSEADLQGVNP